MGKSGRKSFTPVIDLTYNMGMANSILLHKNPSVFYPNRWLDASICGNGRVGAAVTGAYSNESILINHAKLKHGGYTGVLQDVSDKFPQVRKLYSDAKVAEAEKLLSSEFSKRGYNPSPAVPLPLCAINIDFLHQSPIVDYERRTHMDRAEVEIAYKSAGTSFVRGTFVARGTDIVAYNVAKKGVQKINATISLKNTLGEALISGKALGASLNFEGGYFIYSARANNEDYGIVVRIVQNGGTHEVVGDEVNIVGAEGLTIFAKPFVGGMRDTEIKNIKSELSQIKITYEKMQEQNERTHAKIWGEVTLALDPVTHVDAYWNLGKYIAICAGGSLMTPGGLWCGDLVDENATPSFYNAAFLLYQGITLSACPEALTHFFAMFEQYADDLRKNAARVFGAKGYFVPNTTSPGSALFGKVDGKTLHFIASSALAANLYYSYYLATGDSKILKNQILPFMKEVFAFYSDFLKLDNNGFYSTLPSYSPNSTPGNKIGGKSLQNFSFATNSTIDFLAIDALLENLIHASEQLGIKGDLEIYHEMRRKIPPHQVGDLGEIKEYINSAFMDGLVNSGTMHCYGLFPLKTLSFSDEVVSYRPAVSAGAAPTISLKRASANAVMGRLARAGSLQTSQTLAMSLVQMVHSGDAGAVSDLLGRFFETSFTPSGLCVTNDWRGGGLTKLGRPSLDICGNLGVATAITECLVQSNKDTLRILPTLLDEWRVGQINGVATDFAARVSVDWNLDKRRLVVKIVPKISATIDIVFPSQFKKPKNKEVLDSDNVLKGVNLVAGKMFSIEF